MPRCRYCSGPHIASERPECLEKQRAYYRSPQRQAYMRAYRQRPEVRERARTRDNIRLQHPEEKEKRRLRMRAYRLRPEVQERLHAYYRRTNVRERWKARYLVRRVNLTESLKKRDRMRTYIRRPEVKAMRRTYNRRPEVNARKRAHNRRPDVRERHRLFERVRRRKLGIEPRRKTIPEQKLEQILHENFSGDWRYTGQGDIVIGRCSPDFFHVNGKKAIIELYGCYHHNCPTCKLEPFPRSPDQDLRRIQMFEDMGFKTLVIWQHQLKDPDQIVNRVRGVFYGV